MFLSVQFSPPALMLISPFYWVGHEMGSIFCELLLFIHTFVIFFLIDATFQLFQLYHNSGCQLICDMCLPQQSKLIAITFCLALFKQAAPSAIQIACS